MNPRLRQALISFAVLSLAVLVGFEIAQERYSLVTAGILLCTWAVLARQSDGRADTWLLAFLLVGYTVGNRGFAQISLHSQIPLFIGELALAAALFFLVFRGALLRRLPIELDWLNRLLVFWLVLGCGRIWWDYRIHGFIAFRDFAMVYYLLFFFCAQPLARDDASRKVLLGALTLSYVTLPATALLVDLFPRFFLSEFTLRGVPLVLQKGDLRTLGLFAGFIWLVPKEPRPWREESWRWFVAVSALVIGFLQLSRASMVGLVVALGLLALAGRWRPVLTVGAVVAAGLLLISAAAVFQDRDITQTRLYAIYESAVSIVDVSGTHVYRSEDAGNKGDNNRFRLIWWRNVVEDTIAVNPLIGIGFGADIAQSFLLEYYATDDIDFTARSPHNIFITTFARMGALGVLGLLAIYLYQARASLFAAWRTKAGLEASSESVTLHAVSWLIMIGSCFGVVLEGPMGAIPFWIILALAHTASSSEKPAGNQTEKLSSGGVTAPLHGEQAGV